jgi:hypothetical protein
MQERFGIGRGLRRTQPLLQAGNGLLQARGLDWLDEIVEHALSEGLHRILVVGSDEHEVRAATDVARGLDAGHARHVHIEKTDVRLILLELVDGLATVAGLRDDLQLRPDLRQQAFEHVTQERLVVGDQGGRALRIHALSCRAGNSSSAHTP